MAFRDYVNWFNKFRIHGTLGYVSPKEYKQSHLKKIV
ncbi:IS3 family transposase [Shimazuella alba]